METDHWTIGFYVDGRKVAIKKGDWARPSTALDGAIGASSCHLEGHASIKWKAVKGPHKLS